MSVPGAPTRVTEHSAEVAGHEVFWLEAPQPAGTSPVLHLHGVPSNADDWRPLLERRGGIAPDLPGFGRSAKPGDGPYSIAGIGGFVEAFLDHEGLERVTLVMHDWGAAALEFAQRHPERIERLLLIGAVPLLDGYRWHRVARLWRTPLIGELVMGFSIPRAVRIGLDRDWPEGKAPAELVDSINRHLDQGTQRAILKLYRSSPADVLAAAGAGLGTITAPALAMMGEEDPYIPASFADRYAERLPNATARRLTGAGHWPWLEAGSTAADEICAFLDEG